MKRFIVGIILGILIISLGVWAADYQKNYTIVYGVDNPKEGFIKLENVDDDVYTILNGIKDASSGTTAPATPNEGEFWNDTLNDQYKVFHADTWAALWGYADSTTPEWVGAIDVLQGNIENLTASTVDTYLLQATVIDAGSATVLSANIGSATIDTLTSTVITTGDLNATGGVATFDTLTAINLLQVNADLNTVTVNNKLRMANAEVIAAFVIDDYAVTFTKVIQFDGIDSTYQYSDNSLGRFDTSTYTYTCDMDLFISMDALLTMGPNTNPAIDGMQCGFYSDKIVGQTWSNLVSGLSTGPHATEDYATYWIWQQSQSFICEAGDEITVSCATGGASYSVEIMPYPASRSPGTHIGSVNGTYWIINAIPLEAF